MQRLGGAAQGSSDILTDFVAERCYGSVAGAEKSLPALTTNIASASKSVDPLLDTCIAWWAPWPASAWPG